MRRCPAARVLGLPVIMVERPAKPDVPTAVTAEAALELLKPLVRTHGALATERGV